MVTGASDGIGAAAVRILAAAGADVVPVGRSPEKTATLCAELGLQGETADFASFAEVRALADRLRERCPRIDVLANNAGGTFAERVTTVDGNERTFQVNHLSPYLLTRLLEDRLRAAAAPRVVTTASTAAHLGRLRPATLAGAGQSSGPYVGFQVYGTSKLANILFTGELARRWGPAVAATCFHPGAVATGFAREQGLAGAVFAIPQFRAAIRTPLQGADGMLWLASAPTGWRSGEFYSNRHRAVRPAQARRSAVAEQLWRRSAELTGVPE